MYGFLVFAGLFVAWIVLNIWVLPRFGIQTCMSGACCVPRTKTPVLGDAKHGMENDTQQVDSVSLPRPKRSLRP